MPDTDEISAGYARLKPAVNVSHSPAGHHVTAEALRRPQASSTPKAACDCCAVGAQHRGLTTPRTARRSCPWWPAGSGHDAGPIRA